MATPSIAHFGTTIPEPLPPRGATVSLLEREEPGITIGLLTPLDGRELAPRWTEDIFVEAGYSHYRLGAPDQPRTIAASREAFPAGGDVAFVYFKDSYLERVQNSRHPAPRRDTI